MHRLVGNGPHDLDRIDAPELALIHRAAVAWGVHETHTPTDVELLSTPIELLSFALQRLPDLTVAAFLFQALLHGDDARLVTMATRLRAQSAGVLRLCQRALEVHSRNVGYQLDAWNSRSAEYAASLLGGVTEATYTNSPTCEVRLAVHAIGQAIVACESDRMAVPELLSDASARILPLFVVASELARPRRRAG